MEPDQLKDLYEFDEHGDLQKDIRELRKRGPAPLVALRGGIPARAVVDPTLLKTLARDKRVSKDAYEHWPAYRNKELPKNWPLMPWVAGKHAFAAEDSKKSKNHTRLRAPLDQALGPRQVRAMEPRIQEITRTALDEVARAGIDPVTGHPQVVDLRLILTLAVPIRVISDLLGIPDHLREAFQACADNLFDTTISGEEMLANQARLQQTLDALIAYRTEHPGEDLTSTLLREEHHDLTYEERLATIRLILVAAIETVGNLQGSTIVNLLSHPEALTAFQAGEITIDAAINETLRRNGPAGGVPLRYPTETFAVTVDTENGPVEVVFEYGVPILPVWAAAGRDPRTNPEPDVFDVNRTNRRDIAFGAGPHYCAGAQLAVTLTRILLALLFERYPRMMLAVDPATIGHTPGHIGDGPDTVPVLLGPENPDKTSSNGHGAKTRKPAKRAARSSMGARRG
ncbi:cytochrome P450 [Promicromonospora soli]